MMIETRSQTYSHQLTCQLGIFSQLYDGSFWLEVTMKTGKKWHKKVHISHPDNIDPYVRTTLWALWWAFQICRRSSCWDISVQCLIQVVSGSNPTVANNDLYPIMCCFDLVRFPPQNRIKPINNITPHSNYI